MGQKDAINKPANNSKDFVELHIEDLVKDYLRWHEQVNKRAYSSDVLPSVIHGVDSSLIAIR
ncbi:hypothetical protein [Polynucleobacter sp. MWH-UH23A]|uniref:hypothetical protein n=1 Tax=Polynucleobacter sp. MWH-UH23A TaxID=1855613 RepID=UPI00336516D7